MLCFLIFVSIYQFSYSECRVGQNGTGGSILTHDGVLFYPMYGVKWSFNTQKKPRVDSKKNGISLIGIIIAVVKITDIWVSWVNMGIPTLGMFMWQSDKVRGSIIHHRSVNLYGLHVSLMDFCDLHGLTGVQCNTYGYLWFLQIQTYNHSTLYIRTVVSLQWHQLCFVNTKVNDLWHKKLCFVCILLYLYMGV